MGPTENPSPEWRRRLAEGVAIPACPLALDGQRRFDERRQRAVLRYYAGAGVGGVAVGVHTTQFAIRAPQVGLLRPLLELAGEELRSARESAPETGRPFLIAGICGASEQAIREATLAKELGGVAGLVSLAALPQAEESELVAHVQRVAEVLPVIGFYLQPSVGGRRLSYRFWRRFAEIPNVVAVKIAPFNRYQTLDVVRAVAEAGREDIALYTGNDDNLVLDLLTPFRFRIGERVVERRIVGGLLGHWAVWTRRAVELHAECRRLVRSGGAIPPEMLRLANEVTDANAAFFDAAHGFAGCIAGLHEVLRRQGLFAGIWCLDPCEGLSPGQADEIDRIVHAYPHLNDDEFVREHRDAWLAG